jgi:hypothetical protein
MTVDEVVEDTAAQETALKQKEANVKKQKASLKIQKALAQYRKIAGKKTLPAPASIL